MVGSNFTQCGLTYMSSPDLIAKWNYTGPTKLIPNNPLTQITYEGCKHLCGTAPDWYPWSETANTITTWVLPIIGTLLQAPFESNAFWRTVKASCRWLGSPMASLAYILWNIEVSGKCALFVDMATPYDGPLPDEHSDFASMRDSFYILMNINQYKMKPLISMTKEAEAMLRVVLFSRNLKLIGTKKTLKETRAKLARELRSNRRKGVVPVFISTLWFLLSLAISIEAAFGELGDNAQAHDLAMGLFVAWFPILIMCSIIDRNPVASDDIQRKLNKLIDTVCISLQDYENREEFIASFQNEADAEGKAYWVRKVSHQAEFIKGNYFQGFAGQARTRFHYGAAHAILIDIEKTYIAEHGRNWLANEKEARVSLVTGQVDRGFVWFDGRQFWQILSAVVIVVGTAAGAFVLSFFTPTSGLGCRAGGYVVFVVVSFCLLLMELGIWFYTSPIRNDQLQSLVAQQIAQSSQSGPSEKGITFPGLATTKTFFKKALDRCEEIAIVIAVSSTKLVSLTRSHRRKRVPRVERAVRNHFQELRELTLRQWAERCVLQPLEVANTAWLCYIIFAQTFGAFVTCACQSSLWAGGGGYIDFTQWDYSNSSTVARFWIIGTIISCVVMGLGMIYVCMEWCLQAHLSTEDYADAMRGLQKVRRFRRCTFWARFPASAAVLLVNRLMSLLKMRKTHERKALVWTKESRFQPGIANSLITAGSTWHTMPFTHRSATKLDEKRGDGSDGSADIQKPEMAVMIEGRGSVTARPLLDEEEGSIARSSRGAESPESPSSIMMIQNGS